MWVRLDLFHPKASHSVPPGPSPPVGAAHSQAQGRGSASWHASRRLQLQQQHTSLDAGLCVQRWKQGVHLLARAAARHGDGPAGRQRWGTCIRWEGRAVAIRHASACAPTCRQQLLCRQHQQLVGADPTAKLARAIVPSPARRRRSASGDPYTRRMHHPWLHSLLPLPPLPPLLLALLSAAAADPAG